MTLEKILFAFFAASVAGIIIFTIRRNKAIMRDGIETEAVVTRIEESESTDSDGSTNVSYTYYVEYRTLEGGTLEARLGNASRDLHEGSRLRIMYLPNKPGYVIPARDKADL